MVRTRIEAIVNVAAQSLMYFAMACVRLRTTRYWKAYQQSRLVRRSMVSSFRCYSIPATTAVSQGSFGNNSARRWSNVLTRRTTAMTRQHARPEPAEHQASGARPAINVSPLIDVLLVVLIIFLVLTPLKP